MNCCTFFGHRNAPQKIESALQAVLIDLIENHHVYGFYVGNQGNFDKMARKILKRLKDIYPHIFYFVVLAYMPCNDQNPEKNFSDTIFPDGLEHTPPKFAIDRRNHWMLNQCDYVITYVNHLFGGAGKFKQLAEKRGKQVINLS